VAEVLAATTANLPSILPDAFRPTLPQDAAVGEEATPKSIRRDPSRKPPPPLDSKRGDAEMSGTDACLNKIMQIWLTPLTEAPAGGCEGRSFAWQSDGGSLQPSAFLPRSHGSDEEQIGQTFCGWERATRKSFFFCGESGCEATPHKRLLNPV
jgi:hypothetical protein